MSIKFMKKSTNAMKVEGYNGSSEGLSDQRETDRRPPNAQGVGEYSGRQSG